MSIRVVCPNGHELKVKASMAGKTGLCPTCRAVVKVPVLKESLEDSILDMLDKSKGNGAAAPTSHSSDESTSQIRVDGKELHLSSAPKKPCVRCHREVDLGTHICPHCHTYIASLADFRSS